MQSAAWRASTVAQEMLAFSGPRIVEIEPLDLHAVTAGVRPLLAQALQQRASIELHTAKHLHAVQARQPHVEWLLLELALHARRVLGQVDRFTLDLRNDDIDGAPRVALTVSADTTPTSAGETGHAPASIIPRAFPDEASRLPGADLMLAHTQGTLTTHRDDESSVRYELRLPGLA
jgi:hypothetical protein